MAAELGAALFFTSASDGGPASAAAPARTALRHDLEDVTERSPDALQPFSRACTNDGCSAARRAKGAHPSRFRPLFRSGPSVVKPPAVGQHGQLQHRPVRQFVGDRPAAAATAATDGDAPDDDGVATASPCGAPATEEEPKHATYVQRRGCALNE